MGMNLAQVYVANPITTIGSTDLLYVAQSGTTDAGISGANLLAQVAPLTTKGDIYTFSTVNTRLGVGSNNQILFANSSAATGLAWSTATYPSTTTINQILYSSSNNAIVGLATANNGVLITSAGGVPSISSTLPAAVQTNITALGAQSQALNMNTHLINGVVDPVSAQDAATKNYVDSVAQGLNPKPASAAASTTALTVTYANGASGVGATLTNAGAQAAFAIDGYTAALNDVILIKDQASTFQNGLYTVTTLGSGATNWVLTRSTSMDIASEFKGGYTFIINGTVNGGRSYVETATVTTVGTDPVVFAQFSSSKVLSVVSQVITSSATYTPTTGMAYCTVEIVGGGGGAGGVAGSGAQTGASGAGGGGGYCRKTYTAAQIGANAAVVIGAAGTGGAAGSNSGTAGGNSTFTPAGGGAVLTASGGSQGGGTASTAGNAQAGGGNGGAASGGDLNIPGGGGSMGIVIGGVTASSSIPAIGGGSFFSPPSANGGSQVGRAGISFGGGGSGSQISGAGNIAGADGVIGICYVTEYVLT